MIRRVLPCIVGAFVLFGGACSSSSTTSHPAAKHPAEAASPAPYAAAGPYQVGVRNMTFPDGRGLVIWYPADPRDAVGAKQETVDLAGLLTKELQAKIPATERPLLKASAFLNIPVSVAAAPYPVVLFSHGYAGFPEQSVSITAHLASWGMIVVAPEHTERSLHGLLGGGMAGIKASNDEDVLLASLNYIIAQNATAGSPFKAMVDAGRVAVIGHSSGANAAYTLASNPRIKTWISYSTGFDPKEDGPAPPAPNKPGMLMLGTKDGIIPPASTEALYAGMHAPKYLVRISGGGHLVFSDICQIGQDKGGIVTMARQLNLGIPDSLLKLGSDGCGAGYTSGPQADKAIGQLSVAFLRYEFGADRAPVGLSTTAVKGLGATVTVESAN